MIEHKYTILYIDDEPHNLTTFRATFKWNYKVLTAQSAMEGFDILATNEIHLIISDQHMAGLSGIEFFKKVKKRFPKPLRIILTAYNELAIILQAINECGIYRYISKPWNESELKKVIEDTLEVYQLRRDKELLEQQLIIANEKLTAENSYLREEIEQEQFTKKIITQNETYEKTLALLKKVALTKTSVLISGETGTGKELMARSVHRLSQRNEQPFIKVNCAAIPENLIESEFFGHEKGAFTGAIQKRLGRFELADGGTLFLDEIGELPINLQTKLLRVLQEGEFERIGGTKTIKVDIRVIAATNRDLEKAIKKNTFRVDLFYRLNVFPLNALPLRERKEDIPILVHHFLEKHAARVNKKITNVEPIIMEQLMNYNYPGNIRELENLIERFMIISDGNKLELAGWGQPNRVLPISDNYFLSMEEMEIYHIKNALRKCKGKIFGKGGAAELLKMNGKTLSSRMVKLNIKKEQTLY